MTPEEIALDVMRGDEQVIAIAKARWQRCKDFEGTAQQRWLADQKFHWADPDNGWQWPGYLWSTKRDDPAGYKPRLTVNKVRQHNLQITNDHRQNKPGIKITPVGDKASFEAAKIWMGLVRHIERVSKATVAYSTASDFQVQSGLGYIRVTWEYIPGTFDKEIFIRRVRNPLNVFLDPDKNEVDGSDARFGFYFDDTPRAEFLAQYPHMRSKVSDAALGNSHGWIDQDHVRQAEYFTKRMKKDRLVLLKDRGGDGPNAVGMARWSKIPPAIRAQIEPGDIQQEREFLDEEVLWYKIAGNDIVDRGKWPGRFVPLVPVVGEETVIDGILDRKGHTRGMKDAQRMYNFWTSNAVEQVALQTKAKWFIPVGSTDSLDAYFKTINTSNYPYIPINAFDSEGRQLPPPTPIDPPTMADGYIKGMMISRDELMMVSGQREENFGQPTNAISGVAINERQRKGDNATYHYIDGLAIAIRQVGNIILDVAPLIYTTAQVRQILAEDGSEQLIQIDPYADAAYAEQKVGPDDKIWVVFNPKVGRYWVDSDIGPSYATKRQEAWDAFVQLTSQNQELVTIIGDLMFRNADFPGADEIADRLKRMVPPQALGQGPDAALQAAQSQNQSLQSLLAEMTDKLAKQELEIKDHAERRRIEQQDADTRRLKEVGNAESDLQEDQLRPIIEKLLRDILGEKQSEPSDTDNEAAAEEPEQPPDQQDQEAPPMDGAEQAPDGNWYIADPSRPGKYMQVEAEAGAQ